MIQLLSIVVIMEGTIALLLMINIRPLRKLVMKGLDESKRNNGPAMVKTLGGAMFVILVSSITSILKIQQRSRKIGTITPTDQILLKTHMLEASLMGYALFLGLVIDRLHHFLRRIGTLRASTEPLEKKPKSPQASLKEQKKQSDSAVMKMLKDEIAQLRQKLQKLTLNSEALENEAKSAEGNAKALQKQAEVFLLEYDRLLEDNQNLRSQLSALDKTSSNSDNKKDG